MLNRQDAKYAKEEIRFFICRPADEKTDVCAFFATFAPSRFKPLFYLRRTYGRQQHWISFQGDHLG
jgi:hypothetical protein